jgi:EmrB/QacA subfamily drug resistance transporter
MNNRRIALIISTIGAFLVPFMSSSINVALPSIGHEFSMDALLLSWVATSYLLSSAVFLVPFGKIADMKGRKKIYTIGMVIYIIAVFLCAISTNSFMLISFRVLHGIGSALLFCTGTAILTSIYSQGERGWALGLNVSSTYLGLSLGPLIGGFLTQHLGWRSIFWINIPISLAVLYLVIWKLKGEWAEEGKKKFDFGGSFLYSLSLVSLMYGFTQLPKITGFSLIFFGLVMATIFIFWELRTKYPVLDLKLFTHNIVFAFSNLAALINYSATFAVSFLLSFYLQYVKGLSPQEAGVILVAQPLMMTIFSPLAGKHSDKIEPRILSSIGMGLAVICLTSFIFIDESTSFIFIIVGLMILGVGFALFSSPNTNAVMSSVDKRFYGVASSILSTMRLTGQMLSMGIAMLIFTVVIGNVQIKAEYHAQLVESIRIAFFISSILCLIGVFASLARGKVRG